MKKKWICTVCGYVHEGDEAPEFCPQCKQPKSKFKELVETEGALQFVDEHVLGVFKNIKSEITKSEIAKHYGIKSVNTFLNYMEMIKVIRNTCAHGGVLFDISLPLSIANGPVGKLVGPQKNNLQGALLVIAYILKQISNNRANDMETQINRLLVGVESHSAVKGIIEKSSGFNFS